MIYYFDHGGEVLPAEYIKVYTPSTMSPLEILLRWRWAHEQAVVYTEILLSDLEKSS